MGYLGVMSEFDDAEVAFRLREEIARQRLSRARLAEAARVSVSTLEKALSGRRRFTLATVVRLGCWLAACSLSAGGFPPECVSICIHYAH